MIFRNWVLENFPFLEDDFDALTDYELFCKMMEYVKELAKDNEDFNKRLTDLENYINNLDLQDEVNNKLDEMAESGELTDIIAQYLGLAGVLAFNTLNDLVNATNIVNGSICRTLGESTYNDGKGSYYKIRTITSGDVVDGVNIVALNISNTLIAERIPNYINKKYVFMGDSYGDGYSPDGDTTSWITLLANKMNLLPSQYISTHAGGLGFSINRPDYNYISLLQNLSNDNNLTDMYVCGGYNDATETEQNIIDGIEDFYELFITKFPNAKLHLGFIGWSSNSEKIIPLKNTFMAYRKACNLYDIELMNGCQYSLHNYFKYFSSDGIHPNQTGQNNITNALYNCIKYGNANIYETEDLYIMGDNISFSDFNLSANLSNGFISIGLNTGNNLPAINFTNAISLSANDLAEVGSFTNSLIIGTNNNYNSISLPCVINHGDGTYSNKDMIFTIKNGKLYVASPGASGGNYTSFNVKAIQIIELSATFDGLTC